MKLFMKLLVPLAFVGGICLVLWGKNKDSHAMSNRKYDTGYYNKGRLWRDICITDTVVVYYVDHSGQEKYLKFKGSVADASICDAIRLAIIGSTQWIDSVSPPLKSDTDAFFNVKTVRIGIDSSMAKIDTNSFWLSKKPINLGKPHKAKKGALVRPIKWIDLCDVNLARADTFWTFRESSNGFGAFGFYQPPGYSVHLWGGERGKAPYRLYWV